ncbi:MAG: TolC family protein [Lentimicrobium sp.]
MKRKIFFTIGMLVFLLSGNAQQLTPEDYLQRVFGYNQDLKISRENTRAAEAVTKSVMTNKLPWVSADATAQYQFDPGSFGAADLKKESWNANLAVMQNVYSGSSVTTQLKISKVSEAISVLAEDATGENIAYAAFLNYWNTSAMHELKSLSEEYLSLVSKLHGVVEIRFNDGYIGKTDLLMLETRKAEAEFQLSGSQSNFKLAQQQLNMLMGVAPDSVFILLPIDSELLLPGNASLEQALAKRPEYQIAGKNIEIAEYQTKLVKARYLPSVNVGLQESWGTSFINTDNSASFNTIAFANLNVPIFHWNSRKYDLAQSQVTEQVYTYEKSKVIDQVNLELNNALTNFEVTSDQLEIIRRSLKIATENLELNTLSYTEGRLPILDVLSSQLSWLQAYTSLVTSNLSNKIAMADYLKAAGMLNN